MPNWWQAKRTHERNEGAHTNTRHTNMWNEEKICGKKIVTPSDDATMCTYIYVAFPRYYNLFHITMAWW